MVGDCEVLQSSDREFHCLSVTVFYRDLRLETTPKSKPHFNGVQIFSATKAREREELGNEVTAWIRGNTKLSLIGRKIVQSSDSEFHCISMVMFYTGEETQPPTPRVRN